MSENVDQGWVGWEGPRLRVLPILLTLFIGLAIIAVSFTLAIIILRHVDAQLIPRLWPLLTIAEAFECGFALLGIAVARSFLKGATFGIRWPPGRTRVGLAVVWGVLIGIIMLIVDQSGDLMRGITPGARAHTARKILCQIIPKVTTNYERILNSLPLRQGPAGDIRRADSALHLLL
jgi:hypothetical protein